MPAMLDNPNVKAFLRVIRAGEGTSDEAGYRRMFGGELFESFADHPRKPITKSLGGKPLTSTAAGAYQFLSRTWDECAKALGLRDFSPASQDQAALFLIKRRGALEDVVAGRLEAAVAKCAREWASLPGSPYGQPVKTMAQVCATYIDAGGKFAEATTPPKEANVPLPAILAALLPTLVTEVPKLVEIFKPDSPVAERNVKAATVVFDVAKQALGAVNEQEVVQRVTNDPEAAATVRAAVEANWFTITEAGGGGIAGARAADRAFVEGKGAMWHSPSFWALLLLLPLAYMVVGSLIGVWGTAQWSDDVRASIATGIITLIVGGAAGYYWGSTTTRNR
jgi:muramidase (phage lysozyme)